MKIAYKNALISGVAGIAIMLISIYGLSTLNSLSKAPVPMGMPVEPNDVVEGWVDGLLLVLSVFYSLIITGMIMGFWIHRDGVLTRAIFVESFIAGVTITVIVTFISELSAIINSSYVLWPGVVSGFIIIATVLAMLSSIGVFLGSIVYHLLVTIMVQLRPYGKRNTGILIVSSILIGLMGLIIWGLCMKQFPRVYAVSTFLPFVLFLIAAPVSSFIVGLFLRCYDQSEDLIVQSVLPAFTSGLIVIVMPITAVMINNGSPAGRIVLMLSLIVVPMIVGGVVFSFLGCMIAHGLNNALKRAFPSKFV